jgi:hypothetical protein
MIANFLRDTSVPSAALPNHFSTFFKKQHSMDCRRCFVKLSCINWYDIGDHKPCTILWSEGYPSFTDVPQRCSIRWCSLSNHGHVLNNQISTILSVQSLRHPFFDGDKCDGIRLERLNPFQLYPLTLLCSSGPAIVIVCLDGFPAIFQPRFFMILFKELSMRWFFFWRVAVLFWHSQISHSLPGTSANVSDQFWRMFTWRLMIWNWQFSVVDFQLMRWRVRET